MCVVFVILILILIAQDIVFFYGILGTGLVAMSRRLCLVVVVCLGSFARRDDLCCWGR